MAHEGAISFLFQRILWIGQMQAGYSYVVCVSHPLETEDSYKRRLKGWKTQVTIEDDYKAKASTTIPDNVSIM